MRKVFKENPDVDAVIHFAAYSLVGESMEKPLKYFDNNTAGMVKLLEVMNECGVKYIVFSSTAATYGIPEEIPILETTPQNPINPYGESKLMMETIMKWSDKAYGIKYVPLRYFNVAGAKPDGSIGEDHGPETHLLPIILQVAQGVREKIMILVMTTTLLMVQMFVTMFTHLTWLMLTSLLLNIFVKVMNLQPLT